MSVRGVFGFRKGGVDKVCYNQWTSPDEFAEDFIELVLSYHDKIKERFDDIIEIKGIDDADANANVFEEPKAWMTALDKDEDITIVNAIDFIKNSLHCEHAYIFDFDADKLEYYLGYQLCPDESNRYGCEVCKENKVLETAGVPSEYYPCKCVLEVSYEELQNSEENLIDKMVALAEEHEKSIEERV